MSAALGLALAWSALALAHTIHHWNDATLDSGISAGWFLRTLTTVEQAAIGIIPIALTAWLWTHVRER